MAKMQISGNTLANILKAYGNELDVRGDYSGRGMYGRTCLAVVTANPLVVGSILAAGVVDDLATDYDEAADAVEFVAHLMHGARMDSMGLESVVYWPSVQVENFDEDDEDEDEDEDDQ